MAYLSSSDVKDLIIETYKGLTLVPTNEEELKIQYGMLVGIFYTLYMMLKEENE